MMTEQSWARELDHPPAQASDAQSRKVWGAGFRSFGPTANKYPRNSRDPDGYARARRAPATRDGLGHNGFRSFAGTEKRWGSTPSARPGLFTFDNGKSHVRKTTRNRRAGGGSSTPTSSWSSRSC